MHQGPHGKEKGSGSRPQEDIRTPHGQCHSQIAGMHVQKGVPHPVGKIDKNVPRKDFGFTKDVADSFERIGRAGILCHHWLCLCCFDVAVVFRIAGIALQPISRDKDAFTSHGRTLAFRLADFMDNVRGGTNVGDTKAGIGKKPCIAPIEIIIVVSMERKFRGDSSEDGDGIHGDRDRIIKGKGRIEPTPVVAIGIIDFVRRCATARQFFDSSSDNCGHGS